MRSNNIRIQNQQTLHHTQRLPCPVQRCTRHFAAARTLTLHIRRGNHSFDTNHEQTPPSPTTSNARAELRNSSSSPPVHPYNPLFEELEDYNASQPRLSPNTASSSTPSHHVATPPGSPMSTDGNSAPVNTENPSPSQSTSPQVHTNDDLEQLASILGSMFEERAALFEDSSSDRPPRDDAGVPVHRNYHPHLNGMLSSLLL